MITLKDGTTVKLHGHETFYVRGKVTFSHFLSPVSAGMIEKKNALRKEWAGNDSGYVYQESVNFPYREMVLKEVSIIPRFDKFTTYGETFAKSKFFVSSNSARDLKIDLKNYKSKVKMSKLIGDDVIPCNFEDELAVGSEVICKGLIFLTKEGHPCISLVEVTSVGEPVYLRSAGSSPADQFGLAS